MQHSSPSISRSPISVRTSSEIIPSSINKLNSVGIDVEISEEENLSKFARIRQRLDNIMKYMEENKQDKEERTSK